MSSTTETVPTVTLLTGDSLKLLGALHDNSIDMVLFSPPYDRVRTYGLREESAVLAADYAMHFPDYGAALYRVLKPGGVCVVVIGDGTHNFAKSLTSARMTVYWCDVVGFKLFETCIYQRAGNPGAWWKTRFRVDHEYIHIFFKGERPKHFDKVPLMIPSKHAGRVYSGTDRLSSGGFKKISPKAVNPMKCRGTVWQYATSNSEGNRLKLKHPATFPDALAKDLITCFTREGDTVLDPMVGSGTTCRIARELKRHSIGMDINADYIALAHTQLAGGTHVEAR